MVKKLKKIEKAKGTKKWVIKNELILQKHKNSLFNDEVIQNPQIALSSKDDKRIQTFDKITKYLCGTSVCNVCENEMKNICNAKETLEKTNDGEDVGELHITCSIFSNYMKRKCKMEMKRNVKLPNKKYVRYKWLIWIILKLNTIKNIMKNGHIYQVIHTEF